MQASLAEQRQQVRHCKHMRHDILRLRANAERAKRLAAMMTDADTADGLVEFAVECEAQAKQLEDAEDREDT